jgi:hypothetical protein
MSDQTSRRIQFILVPQGNSPVLAARQPGRLRLPAPTTRPRRHQRTGSWGVRGVAAVRAVGSAAADRPGCGQRVTHTANPHPEGGYPIDAGRSLAVLVVVESAIQRLGVVVVRSGSERLCKRLTSKVRNDGYPGS